MALSEKEETEIIFFLLNSIPLNPDIIVHSTTGYW